MFTVNKTLIATAVLAVAGFVAAMDIAQSRSELSAAATVAARFPSQTEMMVISSQPEQPAAAGCTREHWPYIADECLSSTSGSKVKRPTRTIPIERRIASAQPTAAVTR